jgi:hypothetical protein
MVDPPNIVAVLIRPRAGEVAAAATACRAKRAVDRSGDPPSRDERDSELCRHGFPDALLGTSYA